MMENVIASLIANGIFWVLLGVMVWFSYVLPVRRRFEKFFGLNNSTSVNIYLSNLWDPAGRGVQKWGNIIAGQELDAARTINNALSSASPGIPEMVRGFVDNIWLKDKFNVSIKVSPKKYENPLSNNNLIVIGATTKNSVRRHFIEETILKTKIDGENEMSPINIHSNPLSRKIIISRNGNPAKIVLGNDCNPAIIERVQIQSQNDTDGQVLIFCVGFKAKDSRVAVEFLAKNWRNIQKKTEDHSHFAICLAVNQDGNVENQYYQYFDK